MDNHHAIKFGVYPGLQPSGSVSKPCTPVAHIKIAGSSGCSSHYSNGTFIGIDPYPSISMGHFHPSIPWQQYVSHNQRVDSKP